MTEATPTEQPAPTPDKGIEFLKAMEVLQKRTQQHKDHPDSCICCQPQKPEARDDCVEINDDNNNPNLSNIGTSKKNTNTSSATATSLLTGSLANTENADRVATDLSDTTAQDLTKILFSEAESRINVANELNTIRNAPDECEEIVLKATTSSSSSSSE